MDVVIFAEIGIRGAQVGGPIGRVSALPEVSVGAAELLLLTGDVFVVVWFYEAVNSEICRFRVSLDVNPYSRIAYSRRGPDASPVEKVEAERLAEIPEITISLTPEEWQRLLSTYDKDNKK